MALVTAIQNRIVLRNINSKSELRIVLVETAIEKGTTSAVGRVPIGNRKGNHLTDAELIVVVEQELQFVMKILVIFSACLWNHGFVGVDNCHLRWRGFRPDGSSDRAVHLSSVRRPREFAATERMEDLSSQ